MMGIYSATHQQDGTVICYQFFESMVGLEVRSQVDQMFVDGGGLEFNLPPGIKKFFWIFSQEYYPL